MLRNIIPIEIIEKTLNKPIIIQEYRFDKINQIATISPKTCHTIGLSIWDKIVELGKPSVNPQAISKYVVSEEPKLHMKISNIIGRKVINDIYYATGTTEGHEIFEVLLAHVYPNDLYLADIMIQNPNRPILESDRKSILQTHHGFAVLDIVMKNLEVLASELKCNQISLTASFIDQYNLFKKYGFKLRNSQGGKIAIQIGAGIPMEKDI